MTEQCCPVFDPQGWQEKRTAFSHRKFVRDKVLCFMNMPIGFGRTMKRIMGKMEQSSAKCPDWLCLSDHTSRWNMDVYVAADREVQGAEMRELDGQFLSKVYEGPFTDTGKWCKDFAEYRRAQGVEMEKMYLWYTTCPKCAKKYGKNYVVLLAQLKE